MSGSGCNSLASIIRQCCVRGINQAQSWRSFSSALAASSSRWAILTSRGVLQAEGPQALDFLQGIVSNDVRPLVGAGPQHAPVYATILTPKGKFLHDVFIYPHPELQDVVLLDVDRGGLTAALQLLNRYKLRRPIKFQDVSAGYSVAASWGSASPPPGPWWRPDPRLADLGFRALVPAAAAATLGDAVGGAAAASEGEYRALRYRLGVAEGEAEIPAGQAAPLDYNVDVLNGVSYTKGCYVGQERNSFTHYRGVIRKRLMPVRLEALGPGDAPASQPAARQPGSGTDGEAAGPGPSSEAAAAAGTTVATVVCGAGADVVDAANGRSVGQLRGAVLAGSGAGPQGRGGAAAAWGIAYLKLDAALPAAEGRSELLVVASSSAEAAGAADRGEELGTAAVATAAAGAGAGIVGGGSGGSETGLGSGAGSEAAVWRVIPVRPTWWPSDWGREEEVGSGAVRQ